ncbi:hypothetical protein BU17DRAFT_35782 [Hysterangium stoloniferum]|nr:hypothetical protein BU17DRAFT_35782 [Hysterangium stoloniferum]
MRFLPSALVALSGSIVFASANTLSQYKQRAIVDVCATVSVNLNILGEIFGFLNICACLSTVGSIVNTNPVCQQAALKYGQATVTASLTNLINTAGNHRQCTYPDHSVRICDLLNPCQFSCTDGYFASPVINPTSCACPSPFTVCNGVCGVFLSCPSPNPGYKREISWRDSACPHGWSTCGVWGDSHLNYECVDVKNDLWSCGGCGIPLLPTDPIGEDCTAIPGVLDVSCQGSRCIVARCKAGYRVSGNRTTCEPTITHNLPVLLQNGKGPFEAREE